MIKVVLIAILFCLEFAGIMPLWLVLVASVLLCIKAIVLWVFTGYFVAQYTVGRK